MSRPLRGCRVTLGELVQNPRICSSNFVGECVREKERELMRRGYEEISEFDDASTRVHIYTPRSLSSRRHSRHAFRFISFFALEKADFSGIRLRPSLAKGPATHPSPLQPRVYSAPLGCASLHSPSSTSWESSHGESGLPIDRRRIAPYAAHDRGSIDRKRRRPSWSSPEIGVPGSQTKRFE